MITIHYETNLIYFNFSAAARKNVNRLSVDELYKVQEYLEEECYGPFSAKDINEFLKMSLISSVKAFCSVTRRTLPRKKRPKGLFFFFSKYRCAHLYFKIRILRLAIY